MPAYPTISVVVPTYNEAPTLERALRSVLAQSVPISEIIIVDDGSTDDVAGALRRMPGHGPYRLLRHNSNMGSSAARNTGISACTGDYIAFLDADDEWRPQKIAGQLNALSKVDTKFAACVTGFALHRENTSRIDTHIPKLRDRLLDDLVLGCQLSPGSTLLVRRDVYNKVGVYDVKLRRLEDWDWLLRFAEVFSMACVHSVLADIYLSNAVGEHHLSEVLGATKRIRRKHLGNIAPHRFIKRQQFLSTLCVENSAAHYRVGNYVMAMALILRSLAVWPFQRTIFFSRLLSIFQNATRGGIRRLMRTDGAQ